MIKVDLITGFLGSGKTTFLKKYAEYLIGRGEYVGVLENDLGAINVDMMLLGELRGERCELEMVSACCGNDPEAHRRRFKTKLISMGMSGYSRVLIEPSGIFDVDEFFDILQEEPLDRWYEIGNVIAIVDAGLEETLSKEADYILATEAADAGCVVLSRTQKVSGQEMERTVAHLNRALAAQKCSRRFLLMPAFSQDPDGCIPLKTDADFLQRTETEKPGVRDVFCKDWDSFTEEDFAFLFSCGYRMESYVKQDYGEHGGFEPLFFMNLQTDGQTLKNAVEQIFQEKACGDVLRVKGFFKTDAGAWMELNATRREFTLNPIGAGQDVLIVIGENLDKGQIEKILKGGNRT